MPEDDPGVRDEASALQVAAVSPGVTASIFPTSIFATCSAIKDKLAKKKIKEGPSFKKHIVKHEQHTTKLKRLHCKNKNL